MKIFAPSYYNKFKCISDKCKNNCCIGWEIDIDENALSFYKTDKSLMKGISLTPTPHFILTEKDRCPFLNDNNLCCIIEKYGEEKLCQICSDHPRFRNFFDSRTEIGLGLTCEAAAKLILDNDFSLIKIDDDNEEELIDSDQEDFFAQREFYFKSDLKDIVHLLPKIPISTIGEKLFSFERLDASWDKYLNKLKNSSQCLNEIKVSDYKKAKRLLDYFIFRHLYNFSIEFCLLCTFIILAINVDIYDVSRMFSSEIEYSDKNLEALFEFLKM